jgi:hypothetical protein
LGLRLSVRLGCKALRSVRGLQSSLANPHKMGRLGPEFLCIHHGTVTSNRRELEDEVEKDSEGKITSKRQRSNTQVMQKLDCGWRGVVSHRFPHAGAVDRIWILTVTCASHTHVMRNPFAYQAHVKGTMESQILTAKARNMRIAMVSRKSATIVGQGTIPEPSTPHIGKGVALVAQTATLVYI